MFGLDMSSRERMALNPDSYYNVGRSAQAIFNACASDERPILDSRDYQGWTKENFDQDKFDKAIRAFELGFKFCRVKLIAMVEKETRNEKHSKEEREDGVKFVAFLKELSEKREKYEITLDEAVNAIRVYLADAFNKEGLNVR
jgi:hypothetical protein